MDKLTSQLSNQQTFISLAAAAVLVSLLSTSLPILKGILRPSTSKLPLLAAEQGGPLQREKYYLSNACDLYAEGYRRFKNSIYRLTGFDGEVLVVPASYLDELRSRPDDEVDVVYSLWEMTESRYTDVAFTGRSHQLFAGTVRGELTRRLPQIAPVLAKEVEQTVGEVLGPADDWTRVCVYSKIQRVVAIVSASVFVGSEHCRDEGYLDAIINYTSCISDAARELKKNWPWWLRPIGQFFVPNLAKGKEYRRRVRKFLEPIVEQRKKHLREGGIPPDDALQWFLANGEKMGLADTHTLARLQLTLGMAAIDTTTQMVTQV
jgi:hypothetical protein